MHPVDDLAWRGSIPPDRFAVQILLLQGLMHLVHEPAIVKEYGQNLYLISHEVRKCALRKDGLVVVS